MNATVPHTPRGYEGLPHGPGFRPPHAIGLILTLLFALLILLTLMGY